MKTTTYTKSIGSSSRRRRARSQAGKRIAATLSKAPNAIRLRRLRAEAVHNGRCLVCRARYPKAGQKICRVCYRKKNQRAAGYVAKGLCSCGRKPEPGKLRCKACSATNERTRAKKTIKLLGIGRCWRCHHGWPKPPNKTCASCIANISAYGLLRRAANQASGLCACGRKRKKGFKQCTRCQFRNTLGAIRARLAVRAAR